MSIPESEKAPRDDVDHSDHPTLSGREPETVVLKGDNKAASSEAGADPYLVTLDPSEDPKRRYSTMRKWQIILVIGSGSFCTTAASSIHSFAELGMAKDLHTSHEVAILGISLFVEGLGLGPLVVGPLSELYGRSIVYIVSYALFFVFSFPVAFANNAAVFLIFRFITGFSSAAFLSVAAGSVADLFDDANVATPMGIYTMTPFLGPVTAPIISGFINQNTSWRWTYRLMLIWVFIEVLALYFLVPETYIPTLTTRKAARLRKTSGDTRYYAAAERAHPSIVRMVATSVYVPFKLLLHERMALLLDIWCALALGILYLAFQAFPIIFEQKHGFNMQETGLTFIGIGSGMLLGLVTQTCWWNQLGRRRAVELHHGSPPPEERLLMGMAGAIIAPLSLFWLAFTTYSSVHWIVPVIASVPFGVSMYYIFTASFTYLVSTYRPYAASALAGSTFLRSVFAAVFPLFAGQMYETLGTVGATALLAGLATVMAPLPFVFFRMGARLRAQSKFTGAQKEM